MKRIYEFALENQLSEITQSQIFRIKDNRPKTFIWQILSMLMRLEPVKRRALIYWFVVWISIDDVRSIAPNHFCRVGSKWAQFDSVQELMADAFEAMRRGADM